VRAEPKIFNVEYGGTYSNHYAPNNCRNLSRDSRGSQSGEEHCLVRKVGSLLPDNTASAPSRQCCSALSHFAPCVIPNIYRREIETQPIAARFPLRTFNPDCFITTWTHYTAPSNMLSSRIITIHYSRPRLSLFLCLSLSVFVFPVSHFSAQFTLFNKRNELFFSLRGKFHRYMT
jgi:hypothetical protein